MQPVWSQPNCKFSPPSIPPSLIFVPSTLPPSPSPLLLFPHLTLPGCRCGVLLVGEDYSAAFHAAVWMTIVSAGGCQTQPPSADTGSQ